MTENNTYRMPGHLIKDLLEKKGWTMRVLAIVLGVNETGINHIVAGKRPVDAALALALGDLFAIPPESFLDLQKSYDLARAKLIARPDPGRITRAHLFGQLPISDMIKRGWIDVDDIRNVKKVEEELTHFFKAKSPDEIEILPHAAKKTNVSQKASPAQLAWLYRVQAIAQEMLVAKYSQTAVRDAITRLKALLSASEETRKVPRILAESGVRFLVVESLSGAKIDGVCFWLSDTAPVIAMSLRYDRIDNFWFVLRHEIEHVLQHHGHSSAMLDVELEGERAGVGTDLSEEERMANEAASDFCVPRARFESFYMRKAPLISERDIVGFARTLQIHPGLIAGQLQHKTGRYDRFREHQVKIRSIVTQNALTDGWGNFVPVGE